MAKLTLAHYLSIGSLLVSITVLFFGNNLIEKFRGPKVVYSTLNVDLKYPKSGVQLSKEGASSAPNYYREIRIQNTGNKSSTNLSLIIELDGNIVDKDIKSDEALTSHCDSSIITLDFKRFVQGATAVCKVWLTRKEAEFKIRLIDDEGIKTELGTTKGDSAISLLLIIIGSIFLIVSVSLFWYAWKVNPRNLKISGLEATNIELESNITRLKSELDDIIERDNMVKESVSYNEAFEYLNALLDKHGKRK
ncbi:hypothetical protein HNQ91_000423 [Filimonas zeae]|uniref:Uncharacterized protein n=1 Tax=Filimonas zeae TaxID=1737353 RepID=A0A917IM03_9BACT|nr:hypothetical protein [Filimonas zeae]MDR6337401.1 hypothetical protein [Filimonas zeae]GGH58426.1 hypothetical protein GCM10011379_04150 [Filimonas zeae]